MSGLAISSLIFMLVLIGIGLGGVVRRLLPQHNLSEGTQDVVRLGAGLIATIAALVLGLLINSAKSSFDTRSNQVKQLTAQAILLDNVLEQYGPDAFAQRSLLREAISPIVDRLWHENVAMGRFTARSEGEALYLAFNRLMPQNDIQRTLQVRAVQIINDMAQTRFMLFVETDNRVPMLFLAILVFWLQIRLSCK